MTSVLLRFFKHQGHNLSNSSLVNDICIIDSFKTKLHVLAFIPCRADDIHGQRTVIG